jgi:hypothetical protein
LNPICLDEIRQNLPLLDALHDFLFFEGSTSLNCFPILHPALPTPHLPWRPSISDSHFLISPLSFPLQTVKEQARERHTMAHYHALMGMQVRIFIIFRAIINRFVP